jgi:hypothetical protein
MLELNVNQNRSLNFEIQLSGINHTQLEGFLRIIIDGIEYGFKTEINEGNIAVDIPVLKNVIPREVKEGEKFDAKLEVVGNGYYLNPWSGSFIVKNPVILEAKLTEDVVTDIGVPKVDVTKVKTGSSSKVETKLKEMKETVKKPVERKEVKKIVVENRTDLAKPKKQIVLTEDHIIKYMVSKGTTSKRVQEFILEQAKSNSKTDSPGDLLKGVIKFYREQDMNKEGKKVLDRLQPKV